jgi:hypothetical protein
VTGAEAAQRYLGGAGVVCAGPEPAAGVVVGVSVGVGLVVAPGEVVVGEDSVDVGDVGDVGLVVSPGDVVVVSVGLVVVGVVVSVVSVSFGRRTLVRGTQV